MNTFLKNQQAALAWLTEAWEEPSQAETDANGPPFASSIVDACFARARELQRTVTSVGNAALESARRIRAETGVTVDANPYFGITREKIDALVRAGFSSHQFPHVLMALWSKEGSMKMRRGPLPIPHATTTANAKTIFRNEIYYVDMGIDWFMITTRPVAGGDNVWDSADSAAPGHEAHFVSRVQTLVTERLLSRNVSADLNAELTVGSGMSVSASVKFFAYSLLLADALFTRFRSASFPLLAMLSEPMAYLHWNMGTVSFEKFLTSADKHRREPAHQVAGQPMELERWALRTTPRSTEWRQPRMNAIKFQHLIDSYKPIFWESMAAIRPGTLDLPSYRNIG